MTGQHEARLEKALYQSFSATAYPVSKPWKNAWRYFWFESLYRREA